jgi:hypothetical protein
MNRIATASLCLAFALLTFFQFPGHTWLQQDTQIYVPILEHLRDPAVLRNDILVQQPHLAYTLYDEFALGVRKITGLGFGAILQAQQIVTRALGFWGLLLLAESFGLALGGAITVAAICSLGGSGRRSLGADGGVRANAARLRDPAADAGYGAGGAGAVSATGIAAAVAFLYHPPTALPFWGIWIVLCLLPGKWSCGRRQALVPFGIAAAILRASAQAQPETQTFVTHLSAANETLQRMRASYVYVSTWPWETIAHHVLLFAVLLAAAWRVRNAFSVDTKAFLIGLPAVGLLTMPLSWLLLEQWKWGVVPQVQPMRMLLFITIAMIFLCAVAGLRTERKAEAGVWFALAFLLPLQPLVTGPFAWGRIALALVLGGAAAMAGRWIPTVAVAAFFAVPWVGGGGELSQVADAGAGAGYRMGARPYAARRGVPICRYASGPGRRGPARGGAACRVRGLEGGGQVNYLSDFGEDWWFRWQQTLARKFSPADLARYRALGVRYVVLRKEHRTLMRQSTKHPLRGIRTQELIRLNAGHATTDTRWPASHSSTGRASDR